MPTKLRCAVAIVILGLAVAAAADPACAMPLGAPAAPDAASASGDFILRIASVCGVGGCAPVFTKRVEHPPAGFARRAVPLAIPRTTVSQPVNQPK